MPALSFIMGMLQLRCSTVSTIHKSAIAQLKLSNKLFEASTTALLQCCSNGVLQAENMYTCISSHLKMKILTYLGPFPDTTSITTVSFGVKACMYHTTLCCPMSDAYVIVHVKWSWGGSMRVVTRLVLGVTQQCQMHLLQHSHGQLQSRSSHHSCH